MEKRSWFSSYISVVALLGLALTACGGGADNSAATPSEFKAKYIERVCAREVACGTFATEAGCAAELADTGDQVIAFVGSGVQYDKAAAEACLENISASCDFGEGWLADDPCGRVFMPQRAAGEACQIEAQCVSLECDFECTEACCVGTCGAGDGLSVAAEGQSCAELDCDANLFCNDQDLCQAQLAVGQPCEIFYQCAGAADCVNYNEEGVGTCTAMPRTGEACDVENGGTCLSRLDFCDPTTAKCRALGKPGDACDVESFTCQDQAACVEGTCVVLPEVGQACSDDELGCRGFASCENSVCVYVADNVCTPA